jgi:hypothetical protein
VEVNWRAVHIDTENGLQIVPNAALAGDSFVNLSRTTAPYYKAKTALTFAADDPPGEVKAALLAVAEALPAKLAGVPATVVALGAGSYRVSVPIATPADDSAATTMLTHRAWYAAQRAGLHLDAVKSGRREKRAYIAEHIGVIGASLGLGPDAIASMLAGARLLPYAEGEIVQPVNSIPAGVGFITAGAVGMVVTTEDGRTLSLGELTAGDYIGGTSLTRQRMITGVIALTDATLVSVSRDAMNKVVQQDHRLARQIGEVIELRRRSAREALSEAAQGLR